MNEKEKSLQEAQIHITLDHENIIKLLKYYIRENFLIMHLEYFHGVVLTHFLRRGMVFGQRECIKEKIEERLKNAVQYLHNQNLAHCDLHSRNVMVDWNGDVKLIDFGLAEHNMFKTGLDLEKAKRLYNSIQDAKSFEG